MVILIATPSLLVPGTGADTAQIVALVSIFVAALTLFEYASTYPGLVEFRDAPPFNRIRFLSLFTTILLLSVIARGETMPTTGTQFVGAIGTLIGQAMDFPYSPVRLLVLMLPENADLGDMVALRTSAGISYLISLLSLAFFVMSLRLMGWPSQFGAFNVWVNLPTFDPTAGGDVVERLERDARINIALGFLLPFVTPAVVKAAGTLFGSVSISNPQTMIWTVAAWAFLPASLFMRGIAMGRIATMISDQRRRNLDAAKENGLLPA
nr:hypothetical protein [Aliiroseovarius subalbicans]